MRKYRSYDEMTRTLSGLYVELGPDGEVETVFVTQGPVGKMMTRQQYIDAGLHPDFRNLPTKKMIKPE